MNEKITMIPGHDYNVRGEWFKYLGRFDNIKDVPNIRCAYRMFNNLYVRRLNDNHIMMYAQENGKKARRTDIDNQLIDVSIKSEDNELMVCVKELLTDVTVSEFKNLYSEYSSSEMNNMKRAIEQGGNLSWSRFTTIARLLGVKYELTILEK